MKHAFQNLNTGTKRQVSFRWLNPFGGNVGEVTNGHKHLKDMYNEFDDTYGSFFKSLEAAERGFIDKKEKAKAEKLVDGVLREDFVDMDTSESWFDLMELLDGDDLASQILRRYKECSKDFHNLRDSVKQIENVINDFERSLGGN